MVQGTHLPNPQRVHSKLLIGKSRDDFETVLWTSTSTWVIGLAIYMGDWASDATWVKDLHSSLVPLVKDTRYVGVRHALN